MSESEPWFLGQRAELLAMVTFTGLPGVTVQQQNADAGIDMLVSIPAERGGRVFGVEVKGAKSRDAYVTANGQVRHRVVDQLHRSAGDSPFPVGLAVFDMSDDSGYFGWLLAPGVTDDGEPKLERRESVAVTPITNEELRRIVEDVRRWYDSRVVAGAKAHP